MVMARSTHCKAISLLVGLFAAFSFASTLEKRDSRPNIVFILTDDQDLLMNSMDHMENLQKLLMEEGTFFTKHYGHVSQCCPSRTTLWTGKHAHNTNVTTVWPEVAGGAWPQIQKQGYYKKYLPVWLQSAGYDTYYSGKIFNAYTNENYCSPHCLRGWTEADILVDPSTYYYYDSSYAHYDGSSWAIKGPIDGYSTDQIADNVANFIGEHASSGKPFFAVAAPVAPHVPHVPKKEYENLYEDLKAPRTPNFNPDNRTGVANIWNLDQLDDKIIDNLDHFYRKRLQCLRSVDDLVETIVNKLDQEGVLDDTFIIYTSDNGFHMGNHRLQGGKDQCFEEDINLPMIIRGPGVGKNVNSSLVTGHIDMVPTILELAGGQSTLELVLQSVEPDGTPISFPLETAEDLMRNIEARGDSTHVEYWGPFRQEGKYAAVFRDNDKGNTYKALRIQGDGYSLLYSVWCQDAAHELYDMSWDTYQMTNLHPDAPSEGNMTNPYDRGMNTLLGVPTEKLIERLDALVLVLKSCVGESCRWPWKQLHPNGGVNNLMDALKPQYDTYYSHSYAVAKVGWQHCYEGMRKYGASTTYSIENEQPMWLNSTVVQMVRGAGARPTVSMPLIGVIFVALAFLFIG